MVLDLENKRTMVAFLTFIVFIQMISAMPPPLKSDSLAQPRVPDLPKYEMGRLHLMDKGDDDDGVNGKDKPEKSTWNETSTGNKDEQASEKLEDEGVTTDQSVQKDPESQADGQRTTSVDESKHKVTNGPMMNTESIDKKDEQPLESLTIKSPTNKNDEQMVENREAERPTPESSVKEDPQSQDDDDGVTVEDEREEDDQETEKVESKRATPEPSGWKDRETEAGAKQTMTTERNKRKVANVPTIHTLKILFYNPHGVEVSAIYTEGYAVITATLSDSVSSGQLYDPDGNEVAVASVEGKSENILHFRLNITENMKLGEFKVVGVDKNKKSVTKTFKINYRICTSSDNKECNTGEMCIVFESGSECVTKFVRARNKRKVASGPTTHIMKMAFHNPHGVEVSSIYAIIISCGIFISLIAIVVGCGCADKKSEQKEKQEGIEPPANQQPVQALTTSELGPKSILAVDETKQLKLENKPDVPQKKVDAPQKKVGVSQKKEVVVQAPKRESKVGQGAKKAKSTLVEKTDTSATVVKKN